MARMSVLTWPDPQLRAVAAPVGGVGDDLRSPAADMLETMYAAPGRGLAATQVGVMQRLFVMDVTWKDGHPRPYVCINPEIADPSPDLVTRTEGCLSLPGIPAEVARPDAVTLRWTGLDGQRHEERLTGFAATCAQHEMDHLDGRLCTDLLAPGARAGLDPALFA